MAKILWVVLIAFCILVVESKKKAAETPAKTPETPAAPQAEEESTPEEEDTDKKTEEKTEDDDAVEEKKEGVAKKEEEKEDTKSEEAAEASSDDDGVENAPEMACNLKFKRVGCYADNNKKERPLRSYIMSDADIGTVSKKGKLPKGDKFNIELPKFACKCANEAINAGNAVFGLQNLAECWTGPDDSKYDRDGASEECVTFNYAPCSPTSEMCAGKKHANFVYYVDTPEHTKTKEEIAKEYKEYKKKVAAYRKRLAAKKKSSKKQKAKKVKKTKKE
ncbi:uncharacterized protein LOC100209382 [Hydra vulgaris]|uniref:Uncharacterized protein LOC100209382 n=1 Tax=Hydra vulgaris TaxID=6087 RepID=A0ABM4B682_HYDVU